MLRVKPSRIALAVLSDEHLVVAYHRYRLELWAVVYPLLSFALVGRLFWIGGWKAVLYLMLSQIFMTGFLHPTNFGLILSNSHFNEHDTYQPTSSYYGWLNWITFNFGLHTEHHDISGIPWNRLPALSRMAPEFYRTLEQTTSYSKLAWKFAFSRRPVFKACFADEQSLGYFISEPASGAETLRMTWKPRRSSALVPAPCVCPEELRAMLECQRLIDNDSLDGRSFSRLAPSDDISRGCDKINRRLGRAELF